MKKLMVLLLLFPCVLMAQEKGIQFVKGLNWEQVKAKAKQENKYILMDCYTSWCGPCKVMDNSVFPDETIGEIANAKFISVKVQFDEDEAGDALKKEWLAQSRTFAKEYKVSGYPTLLFFNPDGEIVHKTVGLQRVPHLKVTLETVTNPDYQYFTLKRAVAQNPNDKDLQFKKIEAAKRAGELSKDDVSDYIVMSGGLNSAQNAKLMITNTTSSKDATFQELLIKRDSLNALLGEGAAEERYFGIIYFENLQNTLGRKSPSGYYILSTTPDWTTIEQDIKAKHPERIQEFMDYAKIQFFKAAYQWDNFAKALESYRNTYPNSTSDPLKRMYAGDVAYCVKDVDVKYIQGVLDWSKAAFEKSTNDVDQMNYALLLYRTGAKDRAIPIMEEHIVFAPANVQKNYADLLDKMKLGKML